MKLFLIELRKRNSPLYYNGLIYFFGSTMFPVGKGLIYRDKIK